MTERTSRRRVVLIALPLALALVLWAGPGLAPDDRETRPIAPPEITISPEESALESALDVAPEVVPVPECEAPPDPGPDGDR